MCRKCGSIAKSGKISCCGRGGSWFRKCGSAGHPNLDHTWYEGIQACKARSQSKTAIDQQSNAGSFNGADKANSEVVITAAKPFTTVNKSTPLSVTTPIIMSDNSTHMFMTDPSHTSASTTIDARGCVNIFLTSLLASVFCSRLYLVFGW